MDLEPSLPTILAIVGTLILMYVAHWRSGGPHIAIDEKAEEEKSAPKTEPEKSKTVIEKTGTRLEAFRKFLSTKEGTGVLALLLWVSLYYLGRGYFSDTQVGRAIYASPSFFWLTALVAFISGYLGSIEKHKIANQVARGIWLLPLIYLVFVIPTDNGPGIKAMIIAALPNQTEESQVGIASLTPTPVEEGKAYRTRAPVAPNWIRIPSGGSQGLISDLQFEGTVRVRDFHGNITVFAPNTYRETPGGPYLDVQSSDPNNPAWFVYGWRRDTRRGAVQASRSPG